MPLNTGTLPAETPRAVRSLLDNLVLEVNRLAAENARLAQVVAQLDRVPSLGEINQALSATGSHPLNLTGLTGFPVPIGTDPTT